MEPRCRIELLGGLRVWLDGREITRFRSQKARGLLAYLAYHRQQPQPREVLCDLFWPALELEIARNNLRVALTSLRRQLELPGIPAGAIVDADRFAVRLNPELVSTDVAAFEQALQAAAGAGSARRLELLEAAVRRYHGELLPGHYEEWVTAAQSRLRELFFLNVRQLAAAAVEAGRAEGALDAVLRAAALDPLREEVQIDLLRLHAACGQAEAGLRQYREYEQRVLRELGAPPSLELRGLAQQLAFRAGRDGAPPVARVGAARRVQDPDRPLRDPGSLPVPLTRFFGRADEIAELLELLGRPERRLVTLTGPGGTGKTRLAIETAQRHAAATGQRVWFVPLVEVREGSAVTSAIRDALHLPRFGAEALEQLVGALSPGPGLLVLDNFEQLVPHGVPVVQALLERVPELRCLVTSRHLLNAGGEAEYPVHPLPAPQGEADRTAALQYESVQLFVDRAEAASPGFRVTDRNAADVAALCRRLEGLPLALELAAARIPVAAVREILEHLEHRLDFLTSRRGDLPERHRTLRATLHWSYRLLAPEHQRLFCCLSVFRGPWTADAVRVVCGDQCSLDGVEELRAGSLLTAAEVGGQVQFRMLETVREFGWEQVPPEERAALRRSHLEYFTRLVEQAEPELRGPEQLEWLDRLEGAHDNLRAALDASLELGEAEWALRLVGALGAFWYVRGHWSEGRRWLSTVLERFGASTPGLQMKGWNAAARLECVQGDLDVAQAHAARAAELARQAADNAGLASALLIAAHVAQDRERRDEAERLQLESLRLSREAADESLISEALGALAFGALARGDAARAGALWAESLALCRKLGDLRGTASALHNLGVVAIREGDRERQQALLEESLAAYRELGDKRGIALATANLGDAALTLGDSHRARTLMEEALPLWRQVGHRFGLASALYSLARLERDGNPSRAVALLQESLTLYRQLNNDRGLAVVLCSLADLCEHGGQAGRAARLLAAAGRLAEGLGPGQPAFDHALRDAVVKRLRPALGDARLQRELARGAALTPDEVQALALE